jgi:hypothetical protein
MTPEKIFGSADYERLDVVEPAFADVHFVFIGELTSVVGQKQSMRQFSDLLNPPLEGETIVRQNLRLGHLKLSEARIKELEAKGIFYNAQKGELAYTPSFTVIGATRPLVNRDFTFLSQSGFFSRFHVLQERISPQDAGKYLRSDFQLNEKLLKQLADINLELSRMNVEHVMWPDRTVMMPVYDAMISLVKDEVSSYQDISAVIHPRLQGNLVRELTGHAFLRKASQKNFQNFEQLEYNSDDVSFILGRLSHFVEFDLNPLIAPSYTVRKRKKTKTEMIMEIVENYLSDGLEHSPEDVVSAAERGLTKQGQEVSQGTIYSALQRVEKLGKVVHHYGKYKLTKG